MKYLNIYSLLNKKKPILYMNKNPYKVTLWDTIHFLKDKTDSFSLWFQVCLHSKFFLGVAIAWDFCAV